MRVERACHSVGRWGTREIQSYLSCPLSPDEALFSGLLVSSLSQSFSGILAIARQGHPNHKRLDIRPDRSVRRHEMGESVSHTILGIYRFSSHGSQHTISHCQRSRTHEEELWQEPLEALRQAQLRQEQPGQV